MNKKKLIWIIVIVAAAVICIALVLSNSQQKNAKPSEISARESEVPVQESKAAANSQLPSADPSASAAPLTENSEVQYNGNKIDYQYHDEISDTDKSVVVDVDGKSDLKYGLSVVAEQMFGEALENSSINPNSIKLESGNLYIDFKLDIYDLNMGSTGENSLLEGVANVYLDNMKEVKAVFFSVDGNDYSSGHIEIDKNEPFKSK